MDEVELHGEVKESSEKSWGPLFDLRTFRKDKKRLDWFTKNGGFICFGPNYEWTCGIDGCWHKTIRQAIDQAMKAEKSGIGK